MQSGAISTELNHYPSPYQASSTKKRVMTESLPPTRFSGNSVAYVRKFAYNGLDFFGQEASNAVSERKALIEIGTADIKLLITNHKDVKFYTYPSYIGEALSKNKGVGMDVLAAFNTGLNEFEKLLKAEGINDLNTVQLMAGSAFQKPEVKDKLNHLLRQNGFVQPVFVPTAEERNQLNYKGVVGGNKIPAHHKMVVISIGGNGADLCYGAEKNYVSSSHLSFGVDTIPDPFDAKKLQEARLKIRKELSHVIQPGQKSKFTHSQGVYMHPRELDFLLNEVLKRPQQKLLDAASITNTMIDDLLGLDKPTEVDPKKLMAFKQKIEDIAKRKAAKETTLKQAEKVRLATISLGQYIVRYYTFVSEMMKALDLKEAKYGASGGAIAGLLRR